MIFRVFFPILSLALMLAAGAGHAQQYRWIDKDGRVQFTDAPPPPGAKDVRRTATPAASAATAKSDGPPLPFELAELQKNFPVTLYTAPLCKEACTVARGALNKRGIPFTETYVWNQETVDTIKKLTNSDQVPVLVVGKSVVSGYDSIKFDTLLDSAGYPAAGVYPARSQAAPPMPEGFETPKAADAAKPAVDAASKRGPYDTSGLQGPPPKQGIYDASGLQGPPPKTGIYGVPGESK
jgi:glutaredoxin